MRIFGWIYIIIFSIGAVLGLLAEFFPGIQKINYIGTPLLILSIVVFILACIGKLTPRKIFLFLSGFELFTVIFGVFTIVLLFAKFGLSKMGSGEVTQEVIRDTFTWLDPVSWVLIIVALLLSVYGILAYQKASEPPELPSSSD